MPIRLLQNVDIDSDVLRTVTRKRPKTPVLWFVPILTTTACNKNETINSDRPSDVEPPWQTTLDRPLTKYENCGLCMRLEFRERFPQPPTSKETAS